VKIRYRLFLWIGGLFLVAFVLSLFFENLLTTTSLKKSTKELRNEMLASDEIKREHIEKFLSSSLSESLALIDTLLVRVAEFEDVRRRFEPTEQNLKNGTWMGSIDVLMRNKWADLIQTTADGTLLSLVMPEVIEEKTVHKISPREGVFWIYQEEKGKIVNPYLGFKVLPNKGIHEEKKSFHPTQLEIYLLCDWKVIRQHGLEIKKKLLMPLENPRLLEFANIDTAAIFAGLVPLIDNAYSYVHSKAPSGEDDTWVEKEIEENKSHPKPLPSQPSSCEISNNKYLNTLEKIYTEKENKIFLLAGLVDFFSIPAFGGSPFSTLAPNGIVQFFDGEEEGKGIYSSDIFHLLPNLYGKKEQNKGVSSSCFSINVPPEIFIPALLNKVFIGNSLKLSSDHQNSFLSIAVDTDQFLRRLALVLRQTTFVVYNNKIFSVFSENGEKIYSPFFEQMPIEEMVQKKFGLIPCGDNSLYYLRMTPFPLVDLHFFSIITEQKAFFFLKELNEQAEEVIHRISLGLRLVAVFCLLVVLVILHKLSQKMTHPITLLAKATEKVGEGRFEEAELPHIPKSRHDEIATLYHSFRQMVKGLVEKEKVKGILNKVVSPEIAQEILKGEIHLGGEEKVITVLFADIRNFTGMTEKMPPHEVIDLLNTCMTKVSHKIDQFGGVIDKYVGDEVMALFGAPIPQKDSALKAIHCALQMRKILEDWNDQRKKEGLKEVKMGIGIHTGLVVAGNMGAENRLNYTVLGSNVNLAARLCSAASEMEILISENTLNEPGVRQQVKVEEKGSMSLKGFEEQFKVYKVI